MINKTLVKTIVFFLFIIWHKTSLSQQTIQIIPAPVSAAKQAGDFILSSNTSVFSANAETIVGYFRTEVLKHTGLAVKQSATAKNASIHFNILPAKNLNGFAYTIQMSTEKIEVNASSKEGMFMGAVSLLQLIRQAPTVNKQIKLANWNVKDRPNYPWRGFMLDESRHFFGVEKVKQLLDWMAFYKLNKFHWHLTDEPGWRLEIKKYPRLILVGGIGNFVEEDKPATYYTQEQIKEIVAYAADRFIDVIPEIDMPGHATAANMAYPQYSGGGSEKHPEFTFNPGKDGTYQYLTNILREVNVLFPSGLIHLGGDEVSFGNQQWINLPEVKSLMQKEKLADLKEVEKYFIKRMSDSLAKLNSKTLAWDEIAEFNLRKDSTIVFWWRHDKAEQLEKTLKNEYQVVVCPRLPFYFDFVQDSTHNYGRKWEGSFNTLKSIYTYKLPTVAAIAKKDQILGIQANLWTETVENVNRFDYLIFPRITALAEVAWNAPANRTDFDGFMHRLKNQLTLFDKEGVYYYHPFQPSQHPEPVKAKERKLRFNTEN